AGLAQILPPAIRYHAMLWDQKGVTDLGTLGGFFSQSYAINNRRQVVGGATTVANATHGFLWDGSMHDLGTLPSGTFSWALALNDSGQAVGVADLPSGAHH